jgi:antitoxin (DNA-binding transcriptional repressor) of toxin-antitoxin stability system
MVKLEGSQEMKSVNIAKFKAELGKYLGYVRGGEEIIVLDRKDPLARVIPFKERAARGMEIQEATTDPRGLFAIHPNSIPGTDSLRFLKEERADR